MIALYRTFLKKIAPTNFYDCIFLQFLGTVFYILAYRHLTFKSFDFVTFVTQSHVKACRTCMSPILHVTRLPRSSISRKVFPQYNTTQSTSRAFKITFYMTKNRLNRLDMILKLHLCIMSRLKT